MAAALAAGSLSMPAIPAQASEPLQIVTTIFPEYDWIREILGDNPAGAEITVLLDSGVDLHNYQPTAEDMLKIALCDMFVYVGGESDEWAGDILEEIDQEDKVVINLLEALGEGVREEEIVEGMQADHDHEHNEEHEDGEEDHEEDGHEEDAHEEDDYEEETHEEDEHGEDAHEEDEHEEGDGEDAEHDDDHHHEVEYDEHVWLSLRNAAVLCNAIEEGLEAADPANAAVYEENNRAYQEKLAALDEEYRKTVDAAGTRTVLFGDRFPFRYLTEDYGLTYYAAFAGCSAETEASFETIVFLAGKTEELSLPCVLTIEGQDHRIAQTIVDSTKTKDQKILTMDSMQATTTKEAQAGKTYLSIMEDNLSVLREALGGNA